MDRAQMQAYAAQIRAVLTPDLLKPCYRAGAATNPLYGHCYAASEALWLLSGGPESEWTPTSARDDAGVVHWWLTRGEEVVDPTEGQYTSVGLQAPHARGRGRGFLPVEGGSLRAREILRRVRVGGE